MHLLLTWKLTLQETGFMVPLTKETFFGYSTVYHHATLSVMARAVDTMFRLATHQNRTNPYHHQSDLKDTVSVQKFISVIEANTKNKRDFADYSFKCILFHIN